MQLCGCIFSKTFQIPLHPNLSIRQFGGLLMAREGGLTINNVEKFNDLLEDKIIIDKNNNKTSLVLMSRASSLPVWLERFWTERVHKNKK